DCNGIASDGCEANLASSATNCGACGHACSTNNDTPACRSGACAVSCNAGFGNCDGNVATGCEANLNTSVANCGACGNSCATLTSRYGVTFTCASSVCAPVNDHCAGAITIDPAAGTHQDIPTSTTNAAHDLAAPCQAPSGADVFFTFTLAQREIVYA